MSFGSFEEVCKEISLPLCYLVETGIQPVCFARNFGIGNAILFQLATAVVQILSLGMVLHMIYRIKSKFTAVGRKEMVIFFYLFLLTTIIEFLLVFGVILPHISLYPWFVAVEIGFITALFWCLMLNGFVGFQFAEDGTALSLWSIRLSSLVIFVIAFFVALGTFQDIVFSSKNPIVLFIVYFIFNAIMIVVYLVSQVVLVLKVSTNRWALGDLFFGTLFFAIAQMCYFFFSVEICTSIDHLGDGMFLGALFNTFGVMMVYKYWDSITKEDLEFSVPGQMNVWEVREPLVQPQEGMQTFEKQQQQQYGMQQGYGQQPMQQGYGQQQQPMYPQY